MLICEKKELLFHKRTFSEKGQLGRLGTHWGETGETWDRGDLGHWEYWKVNWQIKTSVTSLFCCSCSQSLTSFVFEQNANGWRNSSCPMSPSALSQVTPGRPNSPHNVAFGKLITILLIWWYMNSNAVTYIASWWFYSAIPNIVRKVFLQIWELNFYCELKMCPKSPQSPPTCCFLIRYKSTHFTLTMLGEFETI